jgi:hypothetical protein
VTTATTTCLRCEGEGIVRNWSLSADQIDDHRSCPDCLGRGEIPLRSPDAIARRESAAPHGCTGPDCATCGDDTPALVRYTVARLLRSVLLPCAARIAATATTAAEWHDVAVEAAACSLATRSERAQAAYRAATMMEHGDTALAAVNCAVASEMTVEAWRAHARWTIEDERNATTRGA